MQTAHIAHTAIIQCLNDYFDALYFCDTDKLKAVFHPAANYYCATSGSLLHLDMEKYFPIVAQRISPASRDEARHDRIISITTAGHATAVAHVECAIAEKFYSDFLSLIFLDERWQIIAKVFHYEIIGLEKN
ncbi:nuclear transport factor 2 family protein [Undibacterium amnicola]|uniref:Nuclear transport factor 2 family protein n=1 Tax=Undibacterium amnicola TaxID=1834038 RepID=A0ABR6XUJ5_9BURK|nr:nuclear transport factor 2 family protein [Undibacterium amnicola]MBC3832689.1 nuclear transport factor 2 family protein [Undibacterium amnicola]